MAVLIFQAHPCLETPLSILIHHGEKFSGPLKKAPQYGPSEYGGWSPLRPTWRDMGIDVDEFPEGEMATKFGPARASEAISFLIEFRKIVEGPGLVDEKVENLKKLGMKNNLYRKYYATLNSYKEHDGHFPASFFFNQFTKIPGIGQKSAKILFKNGIKTLDDLKNADNKTLFAVPGIGPTALKKIRAYFKT